jgi:hypothetical protein
VNPVTVDNARPASPQLRGAAAFGGPGPVLPGWPQAGWSGAGWSGAG